MNLRIVLAVVALQLFSSPSVAQSAGSTLTQLGVAQFSQLRRPFYIGGLYADETVTDEQTLLQVGGEKRIEIKVVADKYSQRRFSTQWSQALIVNASQEQLLAFDEALVKFQSILDEPFQKGDVIAVDSDESGIATIYINDQKVYSVSRPGFVELLLSTWIGKRPPTTEFKQELLTASADDSVKALYEELSPTETRISSVKDALKPKKAKKTEKPKLIVAEAPTKAQPVVELKPSPKPAVPAEKTPVVSIAAAAEQIIEDDEPEIDPAIYREQQQTLRTLYANTATRAIRSQVKYPRSAMAKRIQGQVKVQVVINRQGEVQSMQIIEAADSKILNRAALNAVEDAGKLSAIPPAIDAESVSVVIPFMFALH